MASGLCMLAVLFVDANLLGGIGASGSSFDSKGGFVGVRVLFSGSKTSCSSDEFGSETCVDEINGIHGFVRTGRSRFANI